MKGLLGNVDTNQSRGSVADWKEACVESARRSRERRRLARSGGKQSVGRRLFMVIAMVLLFVAVAALVAFAVLQVPR